MIKINIVIGIYIFQINIMIRKNIMITENFCKNLSM